MGHAGRRHRNADGRVSAGRLGSPNRTPASTAPTCASCHGAQAQGGIGPALHKSGNPAYAAISSVALLSRAMLQGQANEGAFFKAAILIFGKVGVAPDHCKAQTAAELRSLQAYPGGLK